jgi:hypothetical protein
LENGVADINVFSFLNNSEWGNLMKREMFSVKGSLAEAYQNFVGSKSGLSDDQSIVLGTINES